MPEPSLVFLLSLYLQQILGYTPLDSGLIFAVSGHTLGPNIPFP